MKLFVVMKVGVYMRGIVGVFDTIELAKVAAEHSASHENDCYHDFYIYEAVEGTIYDAEKYGGDEMPARLELSGHFDHPYSKKVGPRTWTEVKP